MSVFSRKGYGVQSEGEMDFAGSRFCARQVGRTTLSEVMLVDEWCSYWPGLFHLPGVVHSSINNTEY